MDPRTDAAALLILGGAMRSGTTLLRDILKTHPNIRLTALELRALDYVGFAKWQHLAAVLKHSLSTRERIRHRGFRVQAFRYLSAVSRHIAINQPVSLPRIHEALVSTLADSETRYVGDKYPNYVLRSAVFVNQPNTKCVFMYRDPRDVVASLVERTQRGPWRGRAWATRYNTVEKATDYWVEVMRCMSELVGRHTNALLVRYEDLARTPGETIAVVAEHLDLPATGFDVRSTHSSSIGRYRDRLTPEQIRSVEQRAGSMVRDWGYELPP